MNFFFRGQIARIKIPQRFILCVNFFSVGFFHTPFDNSNFIPGSSISIYPNSTVDRYFRC